jgi:enterochelin esterase family protein
MKHVIFAIAVSFVSALAWVPRPLSAQTPLYTKPPAPWVNRSGAARTFTPEVLPDRKITFRIEALTASGVQLVVGTDHADQHTYPMTKAEDGVWSATIGPVEPEIYPYVFKVGGANVGRGNVEVRGASPAVYDPQNVPHGSITTHTYFSKVQNSLRQLSVYVPPQYYSEPQRAFPILYNWGGSGNGRDAVILDNLNAQKKAVPMLMVMVDTSLVANSSSPEGQGLALKLENSSLTGLAKLAAESEAARVVNSDELVTDVMPFVELHYRTLPGRDNRAMVGISHSGGTSFTATVRNLDKFGNLGLLSTGMFGGLLPSPTFALYGPYEPDKLLPPLTKKLLAPATRLKVFYLACGNIDPRVTFIQQGAKDFEKYGVKTVVEVYPGGHQDKAFRPAFVSFASLLFK